MSYKVMSKEDLIDLLDERDDRIDTLERELHDSEDENYRLEEDVEDLKKEIIESETEIINLEDFMRIPESLYGMQKQVICDKLMVLSLDELLELELKYCDKILGFEQRYD